MSDFYVGYAPKASSGTARFLWGVMLGLVLVIAAIAALLVCSQKPYADSSFEFGKVRTFEGAIVARPFPALRVTRPGQAGRHDESSYILVAPGKHGADSLVDGYDGKRVSLQGQLIYRDAGTMLEIVPGSIKLLGNNPTAPAPMSTAPAPMQELGAITAIGEIVDSKCYLGVMNPGNGKVHRDCAARCISGGIPPLFITNDGHEQYLLLASDGRALEPDALRNFVAEPLPSTPNSSSVETSGCLASIRIPCVTPNKRRGTEFVAASLLLSTHR